ncbi:MAG: phosphoribosylglycinamide formyltransferase [Piscirickettsiaceae bacterium]|nr:phosphoribosylglycinamide formyltransferase [Piscirickettsiaceae bacterium]
MKIANINYNIVILISGRGSNMESIVNASNAGTLNGNIAAVISDRPDAVGLKFAKRQNITNSVIDYKKFKIRRRFNEVLANKIDIFSPDLVVLAGFMRILTAEFINHFTGKLINIHPSLLPKFKGLNTHQRAINAGQNEHGASVHLVTDRIDDGPIILQVPVPIFADDDAATLAARVLEKEHKLYPDAINKFINEKLNVIS